MTSGKPTFAQRLDLALKALSISRGRLSSEVAVDKSLVTRWLNGSTRPSPHNLERISRVIAAHCPGFTMLDWESDLETLGSRLGLGSPAAAPAPAERAGGLPSLPFGLAEAAEKETARRAATYAARWQVTRLSASGKLVHLVERALIRPRDGGLWLEHFASGHVLAGWLLVLNNRLYAMVADRTDDSFNFYLLNGVAGPRPMALDGVLTSVGCPAHDDPFSMAVVFERAGDLEGDAADVAWAETAEGVGPVDAATLDPGVLAIIARDFGPAAAAQGGDAVLRVRRGRAR